MFAKIRNLDDLLPHIKDKPEIRVAVQPNGCTVVCYMISDDDTFSGENSEFTRECRGITFAPNGRILCRPLHKFFNVGEREDTQERLLPWNKVARVMDKRDGSMITPMVIGGAVICKSKKSFDSDVAIAANEFIRLHENYDAFVRECARNGLTPIFEFTSPQHRIVLPYAEQNLVLLHLRDNVTGEYLAGTAEIMASTHGIPTVDKITEFTNDGTFSYGALKATQEVRENIEGWVIQFQNGEMVKVKTKWYIDLHPVVVFQTERAIAEMVVDEKIDDLKSAMMSIGIDMTKIHQIEQRIVHYINEMRDTVEKLTHPDRFMSRKDFALKHRSNELFGLMITRYLDKEPDYTEFYRSKYLKEHFKPVQLGIEDIV